MGRTPRTHRSEAFHWTYRKLRNEEITVEEVEDLIYNDCYPPLPGWKEGMQAGLDARKEELEILKADEEKSNETTGETGVGLDG